MEELKTGYQIYQEIKAQFKLVNEIMDAADLIEASKGKNTAYYVLTDLRADEAKKLEEMKNAEYHF